MSSGRKRSTDSLDLPSDVGLRRIRRRRNFWTHAVIHTILCVVLILIWATSEYNNAGGWPTGFRTGRENRDWDPWIIYPLNSRRPCVDRLRATPAERRP